MLDPSMNSRSATAPRPPDNRPTAAARGYDKTWQRLRVMFLRRHPMCSLCHVAPASEAHHIMPLADGGLNSFDNLQAMCKPCHSYVTGKGKGHRQ